MADGTITLNPGTGGDVLDTEVLTRADNETVERERIILANPGTEDYAAITANGDLKITLDGETVVVSATDLDIRALSSGTDSVTVAGTQTDALTDAELRASAVTTTPDVPAVSFATGTKSTTGDTTVVAAPGAGNKLRIHMLHATPDSDNASFPRIIFKGSGGTEIFRGGAIQHSRYPIDLPENEALVINLDQASDVHFTAHHTTEAV